ncbi:hypothetical protein GRI89_11275 [Altererythrobacter salegens]|uniref:DUF8021 domain-containing protein n=1 Tax=Croceibacterium salegens TaxID=1737568 RepID=A0A6I4SXP7_9SPHN|nr:hypothetical protein [Croceibacterium salegens]MXO60119.1 hypothetical protein [Croceibacterium salegens]
MSQWTKGAIGLSVALAGMAFSTNAHAECSRAMLQGLAATYVAAQAAGDPGKLPLADKAYYGENNLPVAIGAGVLSQPLPVDFTRSFLDTTQCATFTEITSATNAHPYVIHTRMEVNDAGKVTVMESIVTDDGDWVFGADAHLAQTRVEDWGEIPEDKRDRRGVLQAAADAYINNWGAPDLPVPHGTPCARLEGRIYTGSRNPEGNTCDMGAFPQPISTGNRRYVIDETIGAVSIFHNFSWIDAGLGPYHPGTPASQTFRILNGKNRYIHEVTVCTTPSCGRSRPGS